MSVRDYNVECWHLVIERNQELMMFLEKLQFNRAGRWHPGCVMSSVVRCHQWRCAPTSCLLETLSTRPPPWPPPPASQQQETLAIRPPCCGHYRALGTGNPSHQLGMLDLPCHRWTPHWQKQKASCHLHRFVTPSETGFHVVPNVLHSPLRSWWVSPSPQGSPQTRCHLQRTRDGPCEAGSGPLHHLRWQEPHSVTPWANVEGGCHHPGTSSVGEDTPSCLHPQ